MTTIAKKIIGVVSLFLASHCANAGSAKFITALEEGKAQTIVCYGTSLTAGTTWPGLNWVSGLGDALNARWPGKATVINSGLSGKNSSYGLENVQKKVVSKNPDVVFIEFSMNDAADSLNSGKTQEQALADAESNLKAIISAIKTSCPSCEIVLQTMNPYVKVSGSTLSERTGLENHVAMYRRVAQENGYLLIDNWPLWQEILKNDEAEYLSLVPDGVHPNESGVKRVTLPNILKTLGIYEDFTVDKDYVLTANESVGMLSVGSGATIDLNGYTLTCSDISGSGAVKSSRTNQVSADGSVKCCITSDEVVTTELYSKTSPEDLFDNDTSTRVLLQKSNLPLAVTYDFGAGVQKAINKYRMHGPSANFARGPTAWTFYGSNDGIEWDELHSKNDESWSSKTSKEYYFPNFIEYRYYRIKFTDSADTSVKYEGPFLELNELEFFSSGQLHINVAAGKTVTSTFTISDNVKVVKGGAGTLKSNSIMRLAEEENTINALDIVDGEVTLGKDVIVGNKGIGIVTVDGGNLSYSSDLYIGHFESATGVMTVNSGNVTFTGSEKLFYVGNFGDGTLTVNGGTVDTYSIRAGYKAGASGIINLNGGMLKTRRIYVYSNAYGRINFNGGTLQANAADTGNGGLITAAAEVIVDKGGGTIDSGNLSIKVGASICGEGAMRFKGGNTITLEGENAYSGGTVIELGTKVVASKESSKNSILGNGQSDKWLTVDGSGYWSGIDLTADSKDIEVFRYSGEAMNAESVVSKIRLLNCGSKSEVKLVDNSIVVNCKPVVLSLDGNKTWSEIANGANIEKGDLVKIVASGTRTLTIDEDVELAQLLFENGSNVTLIVNEDKTLTTANISGIGKIYNHGTIVKTGTMQVSWPFDNSSKGLYVVAAGRINVARYTGKMYSGSEQVIRVKNGAVFDMRGVKGLNFSVVLEEGACFVNGSDTSSVSSNSQAVCLTLEGDASVTPWRDFGIFAPGHSESFLKLGTYTLTIDSTSGYSFLLDNTTISGTGTIFVKNGKLWATQYASIGENCTVSVGSEGTLKLDKNLTVKNFLNDGSIVGGAMLTVLGNLMISADIPNLTLAAGATVKASPKKEQKVVSSFSAPGSVKIDASAINKELLKEKGHISVLTIPTGSFDSRYNGWELLDQPDSMCKLHWISSGDEKMTLYISLSQGTRIIVR